MRVFGEDGDALARAGADVGALRAVEEEVAAAVASLPRGGSVDAHVHLGRDADGHALDRPACSRTWSAGSSSRPSASRRTSRAPTSSSPPRTPRSSPRPRPRPAA